MRIAKVIARHNKQMNLRFECEYCGYVFIGTGYDCEYFHESVVPELACDSCGKTAGSGFVPKEVGTN